MKNGVIASKLQALDDTLRELHSLGQITPQDLENDWRTRRAVERDLQILVGIVIDVCQRLISLSGQAPATTSLKAIETCIQTGILTNREGYRQMTQFRNFIVNRYERIDVNVLVEVTNNRLANFEQFRAEVLAYVQAD